MNNLLKTYNFSNFEIVRGNGSYLYTADNKKLLDFSAGVAVNSLGYNHSVVKKTIQEQLKTGITHLSGSQIHLYKYKLSQLLSKALKGERISAVDENVAKKLFDEKIITNGMVVKVENSLKALNQGVQKIHIISGEIKNALLTELETEEGIGTVFQKQSLDY